MPRVKISGHSFPDVYNAARFETLRNKEKRGEIMVLQIRPAFPYRGRGGKVLWEYVPSFSYYLPARWGGIGERVIEDVREQAVYENRTRDPKLIAFEDQEGVTVTVLTRRGLQLSEKRRRTERRRVRRREKEAKEATTLQEKERVDLLAARQAGWPAGVPLP